MRVEAPPGQVHRRKAWDRSGPTSPHRLVGRLPGVVRLNEFGCSKNVCSEGGHVSPREQDTINEIIVWRRIENLNLDRPACGLSGSALDNHIILAAVQNGRMLNDQKAVGGQQM